MKMNELIRAKRCEKGLTMLELANAVGVSEGTISRWEGGQIGTVRADKIAALSRALSIAPANLMGAEDDFEEVEIPVLGRVQAGVPVEAVEEIIEYEKIPADQARKGEFFGLYVRGDSMEPKFSDGDIVIVKKQETAENGNVVIALINGDEATIKKIKFVGDGLMLVPLNPAYETMYYSAQEIEEKPVRIIGRVVELRARF